MAKIAVVEDNDAMREQLCGFIAQYARESGRQLDVTAFADGAEIVDPYRPGFDIIFLDIEMPTLGGMPTAERIRQVDPDVVLVFVTNMAQYAIRGYEVDALDFVLKPVSYYQFSTKLERALQRIQRRRGGQIALQVGGGVQLLNTDDNFVPGDPRPPAALPHRCRYLVGAGQPAKGRERAGPLPLCPLQPVLSGQPAPCDRRAE